MEKKKKGILDFQRMKKEGEKITWLTAYDYPTALRQRLKRLLGMLAGFIRKRELMPSSWNELFPITRRAGFHGLCPWVNENS